MALLNPLTISQPSVMTNSSSAAPDSGEDATLETAPSFGSQLDAAKTQGLNSEQESTDLAQDEASILTLTDASEGKILQPAANATVAQAANIAALSQTAEISLIDALVTEQGNTPVLATLTSALSDAGADNTTPVFDSAASQLTAQTLVSVASDTLADAASLGAQDQAAAASAQAGTNADAQIQALAQTAAQLNAATDDNALLAHSDATLTEATVSDDAHSDIASLAEANHQLAADATLNTQEGSGSLVNQTVLNPGAAVQAPAQNVSVVSSQQVASDAESAAVTNVTQSMTHQSADLTGQPQVATQTVADKSAEFIAVSTATTPSMAEEALQGAQAKVVPTVSDPAPEATQTVQTLAGLVQTEATDAAELATAAQAVAADAVNKPNQTQDLSLASKVRVLQVDSGAQDPNAQPLTQDLRRDAPVGLQAVLSESDASVVVQRTPSTANNIENVANAPSLNANNVSVIQSPVVSHDGFGSTLARASVSVENSFTQTSYVKLEPHEVSFNSGPVSTEVLRVLKEGGGRVVMEVTPPDQGTVQLDLRLDNKGNAHLVVQGASDSTRARLEQGSQQLFEQFQNMGLNLTMDMRQQSEARDQATFAMDQRNPLFPGSENSLVAEDLAAIRQARLPASESAVSIYA